MIKITFQIITFNSLSILPKGMFKSCIENIYPYAHEILISEGAVSQTNDNKGDATWATKDGRSTDGTLEFLQSFPDPENKIKIFTKNGFWYGKTEMCNVIVQNATGDYIWQIDSDEFYHQEDMERIIDILSENEYDSVHFYANQFFGGYDYCADERSLRWINLIPWMRIFKHEPGSSWITHAPPVYQTKNGYIRNKKILTRDMTLNMGIKLYHYALVQKSQFEFKSNYYKAGGLNYNQLWKEWQTNKNLVVLGDSFYPFFGNHPEIIRKLIGEINE